MLPTAVKHFMTAAPTTIDEHVTIGAALELMTRKGFRHLPVVRGAKLVGLCSERDLTKKGHALGMNVEVAKAMVAEPFCVREVDDLERVARVMVRYKYGCALVTDASEVLVGIVTTFDCMRALCALLDRLQAKH